MRVHGVGCAVNTPSSSEVLFRNDAGLRQLAKPFFWKRCPRQAIESLNRLLEEQLSKLECCPQFQVCSRSQSNGSRHVREGDRRSAPKNRGAVLGAVLELFFENDASGESQDMN